MLKNIDILNLLKLKQTIDEFLKINRDNDKNFFVNINEDGNIICLLGAKLGGFVPK